MSSGTTPETCAAGLRRRRIETTRFMTKFLSNFSAFAHTLRSIALVVTASIITSAYAQTGPYPNRSVKIIVPYAPGGGSDLVARVIAAQMQINTGQTVIVENRAGAGGNLGAEAVWRAAPDGYTLMFSPHPPLVVNKALYSKLAFDPDTFQPITVATTTYSQLLVHPNVPATTLRQFIAYAKANPGKLNYGSQGVGNSAHLSAELFNSMAGVKIVHIPYKGTGPAIAALLAGQIDMMVIDGATAETHVKAGKLRLLAVGSEARRPTLPDIPAISEELPGYLAQTWLGMVAPPRTPLPLANEIFKLVNGIMKQAEVAARMSELDYQLLNSNPTEMGAFMAQERTRWGDVIRATNSKAE